MTTSSITARSAPTASTTRAGSVGVSIDGEATAKVASEAESNAIAVDLGGGNDTLVNTGQLTTTADSTANALGIALGIPADSSSGGSSTPTASLEAEVESEVDADTRAVTCHRHRR